MWNPGLILNGGMVMYLTVFGVCLILVIVFAFLSSNLDSSVCFALAGLSAMIGFGSMMAILCDIPDVATAYTIDEKIEMYEEENEKIEQEIASIIQGYKEYEADTFNNILEKSDPITLVVMFPELKSNELVQKQLEIYSTNRERIKELNEERIDVKKKKWMLYFGS